MGPACMQNIPRIYQSGTVRRYLLMMVCLLLCCGCTNTTKMGSMYSYRISWNDYERPAIVCDHYEARSPTQERVNYYRWLHSGLLTETPVSEVAQTNYGQANDGQAAGAQPPSFWNSMGIGTPPCPENCPPLTNNPNSGPEITPYQQQRQVNPHCDPFLNLPPGNHQQRNGSPNSAQQQMQQFPNDEFDGTNPISPLPMENSINTDKIPQAMGPDGLPPPLFPSDETNPGMNQKAPDNLTDPPPETGALENNKVAKRWSLPSMRGVSWTKSKP